MPLDSKTIDTAIVAERRKAVAELLSRVREIEAEKGVTRESLEEIRSLLEGLSRRKELFWHDHFPQVTPETGDKIYLLSEEPDGRFALYLSCGQVGKNVWPHDHTTWAVIVGLAGEEENRIYEIVDKSGGPAEGRAQLREVRRKTLVDGVGIAFLPDDIHSIHSVGAEPTRHFHLYGLSLEKLPNRVMYNTAEGTWRRMPANSNIVKLDHA